MTFRTIKSYELPFLIRVLENVGIRWPRLDPDRSDAFNLAWGLERGWENFLDDRDRRVIRRALSWALRNPTYYLRADGVRPLTMRDIERELTHLQRLVEQPAPVAIEYKPYHPTTTDRIVDHLYSFFCGFPGRLLTHAAAAVSGTTDSRMEFRKPNS